MQESYTATLLPACEVSADASTRLCTPRRASITTMLPFVLCSTRELEHMLYSQ